MPNDSPISERDLNEALTQMAAALAQFKANYAVIGGMATGFRSQPRFTKDLDLLISVPQLVLPALLDELRHRGFDFDPPATMREWTQHHMAVLSFRGIRIDWLKPVIPAYTHILDLATEELWLSQPIRVASAEGLVLLKLMAFRTQDQLDIENLVAAHQGTLDLEWIKTEWQALASLDDPRLRRFLELVRDAMDPPHTDA
jgi:hypothetical protein